jgi:hypothetical protein
MTGVHSYQSSLDQQVKVSVSGWGARFSASVDYKSLENETSSQQSVLVQSSAQCEVYAATLNLNDAPSLSSDFLALAAALPAEYDKEAYLTLLSQYGTHVVTGLHLGGRFGQHSSFTVDSYTQMEEENVNIEVAAGFSAWGASADASSMTDDEKKTADTFNQKKTTSGVFTVGGQYNHDAEKWIPTVRALPMPVTIELMQLDSLFDSLYMPASSAAKQENTQRALLEYCTDLESQGTVSSCTVPGPDSPVPEIPSVQQESTPPEDSPDNRDYHYLNRHNIDCGSSSSIQQFQLHRPSDHTMQYQYTCAKPVSPLGNCQTQTTPQTPGPNGDYGYLDRQQVACPGQSVLSRFQLELSADYGHIDYAFTCCQPMSGVLRSCRDTYTQTTDSGWPDYHYLDRQNVECNADEALQKFQMHRPSKDTINYLMTCCKLPLK